MLVSELVTQIINPHIKAGGVSAVPTSDATGIYRFTNRAAKGWTRWCYTHFDEVQAIATVNNQAIYDIAPMFAVEAVMVNGKLIRNRKQGLRPENRNYFMLLHPLWMTDTTGVPEACAVLPRKRLWFWRTPNAAISNTNIAGFVEHPVITDGTETLEVEDHVIDLFAVWVKVLLATPHATGSELYGQIKAEDLYAAKAIRDYRHENQAVSYGLFERGRGGRKFRI